MSSGIFSGDRPLQGSGAAQQFSIKVGFQHLNMWGMRSDFAIGRQAIGPARPAVICTSQSAIGNQLQGQLVAESANCWAVAERLVTRRCSRS
jgi:hypothetical protein